MNNSFAFTILLIIQIISFIHCVVNIAEYNSKTNPLSTNSYKDFLGIEVACPSKGALKKFSIKTDASNVWYSYTCYSSLTDSNEYDESILKSLFISNNLSYNYKSSELINILNKIDVLCPVDYALSRFIISTDKNQQQLNVDYSCVGVKSSYQTKKNTISSDVLEGPPNSLDAIAGLPCGDNTIETEQAPGTPLRGFKFYFNVESDSSAKGQFYYSYHKLRSIELERKQWSKNTEEYRTKNNQKN